MSFFCMARTFGPLDKQGNGIILQSFVLALCVLMFLGKSKSPISHDYHHIKKVNLVRLYASYACVH